MNLERLTHLPAVGVICLALGGVAMIIGSGPISHRSEAIERLRTWPRAEATVVRTDVVRIYSRQGTPRETYHDMPRATVAFTSTDGTPREGLVFDGRDHAMGEALAIHFDPRQAYRPGSAYAGREVYTEQRLRRDADACNLWSAAAWIAAGAALAAFGILRLYRAYMPVRHRSPAAP